MNRISVFGLLLVLLVSEANAQLFRSYCNCAMCQRNRAAAAAQRQRPVLRPAPVQRQQPQPTPVQRPTPDLTLVSTPHELVDAIFNIVGIRPNEHFVDLGCGDGRFVIAAAKRGAMALGVELHPETAQLARDNIYQSNQFAAVVEMDVRTISLASFDFIVMYLFEESFPSFETLKPGSVVVSIAHPIPNAKRVEVTLSDGSRHIIFILRTPPQ